MDVEDLVWMVFGTVCVFGIIAIIAMFVILEYGSRGI